MNREQILRSAAILAFIVGSFNSTTLVAQGFDMSWYTIDAGGGYSTGGNFEIEGTIGQHDAGPNLTGGNFVLTGGFWVSAGDSVVTVTPDSFSVTRGQYFAGGLPELAESDNLDLSLRRLGTDIQSRTEFEVKSTSPTATPTRFEFALEGAVFARSNVVQTIELFDYDAAAWELVSTTNAASSPAPDSVVTATPTGDLSRFVEPGTMSIEARIHFQSDSPRQRFASNTDQTIWTIGQ